MIDAERLNRLWEGVCLQNSAMQRAFYMETYNLFYGICNRYAPNAEDAEQWVHDGYIKIFKNAEKYTNTGSLEGWLKRLVVNTCLDNLRQLKARYNSVHLHTKDPDTHAMHITTMNDAILNMDGSEILALINELPQVQRTVFNLYAIEGYSHKEIAEKLGMKEANSQWHLNKARNILKEKLAIKKKLVEAI